jgi:hypothetical protein
MISKETYEAIMDNREVLDSAIIYDRDFAYNYVSRLSRLSTITTDFRANHSSASRPSSDHICSESTAGSPSDLST